MLPTKEEVNTALEYVPETGALLWKARNDRSAYWNRRYAGAEAGTVRKSGYRMLNFEKRSILAHRVVWFMHYGEWPPLLDHKDRNPSNNRIENLRPATRKQNKANSVGWGKLPKGVSRNGNKFYARIGVDYKLVHIGSFNTPEAAHEAYMKKAKELWGEFAPED